MIWSSSLETGIPEIDEQHKELFRQIDILLDRSKDDRIHETLKFLGNYVVKHFTDEQLIHLKAKYPKAADHKKLHTAFVEAYNNLSKDFSVLKENERLPVVLKINKTVMNWLKDHILVHDKEFAAYYKTLPH